MPVSLNDRIRNFYDASSELWEQVWGEHMHHGYYGLEEPKSKDRRAAQIELIEQLLQWANVQQADRILDVGCGIGGSSLYLAQKFAAAVTGITLSPVQAKRATERAMAMGILPVGLGSEPSAQFWVGDALVMPFPDQAFDLVWSLESGEHMPNKSQFLYECYRVLKPGGTLVIATWCHRPTDEQPLTSVEQQLLAEICRVYCLPPVISLPDYAAIAQQLKLPNLQLADWSNAVAPFWDQVIESTIEPRSLWGVLRSGWSMLQSVSTLGLMRDGYRTGLIRYGLLCTTKP